MLWWYPSSVLLVAASHRGIKLVDLSEKCVPGAHEVCEQMLYAACRATNVPSSYLEIADYGMCRKVSVWYCMQIQRYSLSLQDLWIPDVALASL